ncbi:MAG TPA: tetratricopeptide repeat protein, partial [Chloroflexia bacterium]|nr:tetratricopeptide repeat protein [Chloroflexia bacterium]
GDEAGTIEAVLESLADKSLVWHDRAEGATHRFAMLETIKEYGIEKLEQSGEAGMVLTRQAQFFADLAEQAEQQLRGPEQAAWLDRLEAEHSNLRALLDRLVSAGDFVSSLRIAGPLWRFWFVRGYLTEGRQHLSNILSMDFGTPLDRLPEEVKPAWAKALNGAGILAGAQGDYEASKALFRQGLALERDLGNKASVAGLLSNLGNISRAQGNLAEARALQEESLAQREALGDKRGIALSLSNLGNVALDQEDYAASWEFQERSLHLLEELGDLGGVASSLNNLGAVAYEQKEYARAREFYERSLHYRREIGDKHGIALALCNLGEVSLNASDKGRARQLFAESIEIMAAIGDKQGTILCLQGYARVNAAEGQGEKSAVLWGAVDAARELLGSASLSPAARLENDRLANTAREQLGESAWSAAWERGRRMTLQEAIAYTKIDDGR